jgi:N6-L-threonylcarbamoyladenine synthase
LNRQGLLSLCPEPEQLAVLCASFNWAVSETLRIKTERALDREKGICALIVAGGVAANSWIRKAMGEIAQARRLSLMLPRLSLCTDNASMIAYAGWLALQHGYRHDLDLESIPRGRAVPEDWIRI